MATRLGSIIAFAVVVVAAISGACTSSSTSSKLVDGVFTSAEWDTIQGMSPLPELPANGTNRYADNAAAATLGQKLFFETGYTGAIVGGTLDQGQIANCCAIEKYGCATCHDPNNYFIQTNAKPNNLMMGVTGYFKRNVPTVMNNPVYLRWNFWDGRRDSIWANAPNCEGSGMRGSRNHIAHMLYKKYKDEYNAIVSGDSNSPPLDADLDLTSTNASRFPIDAGPYNNLQANKDAWHAMAAGDQVIVERIVANFGKFIDAYVRKLVTPGTPFDRYVAGDKTAITSSAKRGLKVFIGKGNCVNCHKGPLFSDDDFHNTGMGQTGIISTLLPDPNNPGFGVSDTGRFGAFINSLGGTLTYEWRSNGPYSDNPSFYDYSTIGQDESQTGEFHTPGLRNIEKTAPYMHAGAMATLEDVVAFYNRGGDNTGFLGPKSNLILPLNLTNQEQADLVEFLKSLTADKYPDAALLQNLAATGGVYQASDLQCVLATPPQCSM